MTFPTVLLVAPTVPPLRGFFTVIGSAFGATASLLVESGAADQGLVAIIGAIAGAAGSFFMLFLWAKLITKSQSSQVKNLIEELAAERQESARLRAELSDAE